MFLHLLNVLNFHIEQSHGFSQNSAIKKTHTVSSSSVDTNALNMSSIENGQTGSADRKATVITTVLITTLSCCGENKSISEGTIRQTWGQMG